MEQGTYPFSSGLILQRYTKMGPAGNLEPSHDIPSVIADRLEKVFFI